MSLSPRHKRKNNENRDVMKKEILDKEISDMYDKEELGSNASCAKCKGFARDKSLNLVGPISAFHVGSNFGNDKYKIVFVGKNTWYGKEDFEKEKVKDKHYADSTKKGRASLKKEANKNSKYWDYIISIVKKLYEDMNLEDAIENISITNIIKCNTTGEDDEPSDKTPKNIKENCINFKILEKEIETLKPKHIIFLTGKSYDEYIEKFNFGKLVKDGKKETKNNGKIVWWELEFSTDKGKIKVLRTSHPQGKKKDVFVDEIVKWIEAKS